MNKPNTALHESMYASDWITWVGWRIKQNEWKNMEEAVSVVMKETKYKINPRWISGWFCPACEGEKVFQSECCINCDGKGVFESYRNEGECK